MAKESKTVRIDLDPQGPVTYDRGIKIPNPEGKALEVKFTFIHRDSEQMAELQESWHDRSNEALEYLKKAAESEAPDAPLDLRAKAQKARAADADAVMEVATAWNLEGYTFTKENVVKFLTRYPAAALAIINDYRVGHNEGRLGN